MKKCTAIIVTLLTLLLGVFSALFPTTLQASADTTVYTDVLDDLEKDSTFDLQNYPAIADDYSLQVLTVAEGEHAQLFVYVYQPSYVVKPLQASSINISTGIHNLLSFKNYKLRLLNFDGMFQKYAVEDLIVSTDTSRVYEVSSIFRVWDSTIDDPLDVTNENTIDEVVFPVGKRFIFEQNGIYNDFSVEDTDYITVTDKYCGFMRYNQNSFNFSLSYEAFDVHFVAFSTDKRIDRLLQADVYYTTQFCHNDLSWGVDNEFGEKIDEYAYLDYTKDMVCEGNGWFSYTYNWKSIETIDSFIDSEHSSFVYKGNVFDEVKTSKVTVEGLEDLKNKQWVLRYAATEYIYYENGKGDVRWDERTICGSTSILRLYFETDGNVYNLGVIDNKQTEGSTPDNTVKTKLILDSLWERILQLVAILIVVYIVIKVVMRLGGAVLKKILGWIWELFKFVIKLIFRIAFFPLWLLFGGSKKKK